jgi:hypothetical protein
VVHEDLASERHAVGEADVGDVDADDLMGGGGVREATEGVAPSAARSGRAHLDGELADLHPEAKLRASGANARERARSERALEVGVVWVMSQSRTYVAAEGFADDVGVV